MKVDKYNVNCSLQPRWPRFIIILLLLIHWLVLITLCPGLCVGSLFCNHLAEEKVDGHFTLKTLLSCDCLSGA